MAAITSKLPSRKFKDKLIRVMLNSTKLLNKSNWASPISKDLNFTKFRSTLWNSKVLSARNTPTRLVWSTVSFSKTSKCLSWTSESTWPRNQFLPHLRWANGWSSMTASAGTSEHWLVLRYSWRILVSRRWWDIPATWETLTYMWSLSPRDSWMGLERMPNLCRIWRSHSTRSMIPSMSHLTWFTREKWKRRCWQKEMPTNRALNSRRKRRKKKRSRNSVLFNTSLRITNLRESP